VFDGQEYDLDRRNRRRDDADLLAWNSLAPNQTLNGTQEGMHVPTPSASPLLFQS